MICPLLHLIATRLQLLLDHGEAYAELFAAETTQASAHWTRKAVLPLAAACSLGVALILTGVAVLREQLSTDLALLREKAGS